MAIFFRTFCLTEECLCVGEVVHTACALFQVTQESVDIVMCASVCQRNVSVCEVAFTACALSQVTPVQVRVHS